MIEFSNKFMNIFIKFIKYNDVEDLESAKQEGTRVFVGFYLSFFSFVIRNFTLTISGYTTSSGKRKSTLKGFHIKGENYIDVEEYEGDVEIVNGWLYAYLVGKNFKKRINLIGKINEGESYSFELIKASLQAITTSDRLFCCEALLYPLSSWELIENNQAARNDFYGPVSITNKLIPDKIMAIISFYLVLHRNTFAFTNEIIDNIENLNARGNDIRNCIHICGVYRIWNFDITFSRVIQSYFEIKKDGTAYLYPYFSERFYENIANTEGVDEIKKKLQKQPALINISRIHSGIQKLVVLTFGKPGLSIVNVAMFDFPNQRSNGETLNGDFITLGNDKKIISNSVVMRKEESPHTLTICEFTIEEIKHLIKQEESLRSFWVKLNKTRNKKNGNKSSRRAR